MGSGFTLDEASYQDVSGIRTFKLLSPASMSMTWRLWSRLARRPATTQPHEPPPTTMMSTSSGIVILIALTGCEFLITIELEVEQKRKSRKGRLDKVFERLPAQSDAR